MKYLFTVLLLFILTLQSVAGGQTLSAGVTVEDFPETMFGCWRVVAKLENTNNYRTFKPQSVDIWNLTRVGETITLENPLTGAKSEISIKAVEGNLVVFSKRAPYDNKVLTDTVSLRLNENEFSGINTLSLETFSLIDNSLIKSENARYIIKGEKISGTTVLDKSN